ncbi:MAG: hypothetical protein EA370_05495 [Wenzhouxiangella sp.]|nr:MAG: hypothetical protein EA370_05495 [Wenzhouxiangella sp.]
MSLLALSELSPRERRRLGLEESVERVRRQPSPAPDFLSQRQRIAEPLPWWQRRYDGSHE